MDEQKRRLTNIKNKMGQSISTEDTLISLLTRPVHSSGIIPTWCFLLPLFQSMNQHMIHLNKLHRHCNIVKCEFQFKVWQRHISKIKAISKHLESTDTGRYNMVWTQRFSNILESRTQNSRHMINQYIWLDSFQVYLQLTFVLELSKKHQKGAIIWLC